MIKISNDNANLEAANLRAEALRLRREAREAKRKARRDSRSASEALREALAEALRDATRYAETAGTSGEAISDAAARLAGGANAAGGLSLEIRRERADAARLSNALYLPPAVSPPRRAAEDIDAAISKIVFAAEALSETAIFGESGLRFALYSYARSLRIAFGFDYAPAAPA